MTDRCQYCKTPLGTYGATPCCAWAEIDSLKARLAKAERRADQISSDWADFESRLEFLSSAVTRIAATGHTISEAVAALNREAALRERLGEAERIVREFLLSDDGSDDPFLNDCRAFVWAAALAPAKEQL